MKIKTSSNSNSASTSTLTGTNDRTYLDVWTQLQSPPMDHGTLHSELKVHDTPGDLVEYMLDTDPATEPICFLTLVLIDGEYFVVPYHSLERARGGRESSLRSSKVAVECDLDRTTGMVTMRRFDGIIDQVMETDHMVLVPTHPEGMEEVRMRDTTSGLLPAIRPNYAKSEEVTYLRCCPITVEQMIYLGPSMLTPLEVYDLLVEWNAEAEDPMKDFPALQWARGAALWRYKDPANKDDESVAPPPQALGEIDRALPPLRMGKPQEAQYVINRLKTDLAQRYMPQDTTNPGLANLTDVVAELGRHVKDSYQEGRTATGTTTTSIRTWQKVNSYTYESLSKLFGTTTEEEFPEGFKRLVAYPVKEWRGIMEQALDTAGGRSPGRTPVVTRLLADNVTRGKWCTKGESADHFELAVSIFAFILPNSKLGEKLRERNLLTDAQASGEVQVNVEEFKALYKQELTLIRDTDTLDVALSMMDTFMSEYEEEGHAMAFHQFYVEQWPEIRRYLNFGNVPRTVKEPELTVACHIAWIQNEYWLQLSTTPLADRMTPIPLPDYGRIYRIVVGKMWHCVAHEVPDHYWEMIERADKIKSNNKTRSDDSTAGDRSGAGGSNNGQDGGSREETNITTDNPSLNSDWKEAWEGDGRYITTLNKQGQGPKTRVDGRLQFVCLAWNLKGRCTTKCRKRATHYCTVATEHTPKRNMPNAVKATMDEFVGTFGTNKENAGQNE
mmetsp:Transcript_50704/g.122310  ORF Transcript_50704/g.122310 Transcript_50704/m.122310 type:complete len:727 (-) Transcript_50704:3667-5847(-)